MTGFQFAASDDELAEGDKLLVEVAGEMVILFREGGKLFCLDDVCSHDGGTLSDGEYHCFEIKCPRHGARFDVRTGRPLCMPATQPTGTHDVRVVDGNIEVCLNR